MSRAEYEREREILRKTEKALDEAAAVQASKAAIEAVLTKISQDAEYARLFPAECEEFALLTYALARLFDAPIAQVREKYFPAASEAT